jgi:hypothetical protein
MSVNRGIEAFSQHKSSKRAAAAYAGLPRN